MHTNEEAGKILYICYCISHLIHTLDQSVSVLVGVKNTHMFFNCSIKHELKACFMDFTNRLKCDLYIKHYHFDRFDPFLENNEIHSLESRLAIRGLIALHCVYWRLTVYPEPTLTSYIHVSVWKKTSLGVWPLASIDICSVSIANNQWLFLGCVKKKSPTLFAWIFLLSLENLSISITPLTV